MRSAKIKFWNDKNNVIEESKKYSSRTSFLKGSHGAYDSARKNKWLDEMPWLDSTNKRPKGYWKNRKKTNGEFLARTFNNNIK